MIPPLVAFVMVAAVLGLMFEFAIASARAKAVDPVAVGVLGSLASACIPALVGLYLADSRKLPPEDDEEDPPPPPRPRIERTGDRESDEFNEREGWLECWGAGRWIRC